MFIWKATFIDFEENYHAYVYMRPTFIQHSRVNIRVHPRVSDSRAHYDRNLPGFYRFVVKVKGNAFE